MGMSRRINQMMTAPFPRCFHRISCVHLPPAEDDDHHHHHHHHHKTIPHRRRHRRGAIIKLIKYDGGVTIYDRPIKAWELMEEHPKHMVCRSDCFYIGQKTPALRHEDRLQPGHNYFLLPANFFQSALSFAAIVRYRSAVSGGGGAMPPPFEVERTPTGALRIKITDEMIVQMYQAGESTAAAEKIAGVCTTPQLRRDYEQLVGRRHHWKPKLDTISEKKSKKKMRKKSNQS